MEFFTLITQVFQGDPTILTPVWAKRAKSVDISTEKMKKKKVFVQILLCNTCSCQPIDTIFETQLNGTRDVKNQ